MYRAPGHPPGSPRPTRRRIVIAVALFAIGSASLAQLRSFPENTKVGLLLMGNFPEAQLDNKSIVFAPGARILNESNISVTPMTIQGPVRIRYRLDPLGQINLAWVLSTEEAQAADSKK